jgi:hypothetical protein
MKNAVMQLVENYVGDVITNDVRYFNVVAIP